jgi:pilus assembly protein CpaC
VPPLPTEYENNNPSDLALFLLGIEGTSATPRQPAAAPGTAKPSGATGFER